MGNKRKASQDGKLQAKQRKKHKKAKAIPQDVPLPEAQHDGEHEEEDMALSDEDVDFVQQHGQQLGFLANLNAAAIDRAVHDKQKGRMEVAKAAAAAAAQQPSSEDDEPASDDAEEGEEYERRPRTAEKEVERPSQGLPIKTPDGAVVYEDKLARQQLQQQQGPGAPPIQVAGIIVEDSLEELERARAEAAKRAAANEAKRRKEEQKAQQAAAKAAQEAAAAAGLPPALSALAAIADKAARREAAKQAMATSAQRLLAAPEEHVGELQTLLALAADGDAHVARLAQLSLLAVFKDIVPGYRIRPPAEREQQGRVSKEVQRLWDYEATLLRSYQAYLKTLLAAANGSSKASTGGSKARAVESERIAVRCMVALLEALPHFNYTTDLLQALVPRMVAADAQVAAAACGAIQNILTSDVLGKVALEALQLVADLVKRRKCACPPSVLRRLLVMRFTEIKPCKADEDAAAAPKKGGKSAGRGGKAGRGGDAGRGRGSYQLDRDFAEAEVAPDAQQQAILQSQMLEALFEVFFRVLKHCSSGAVATQAQQQQAQQQHLQQASQAAAGKQKQQGPEAADGPMAPAPWSALRVAKHFPLLHPALEGVGRYCHLLDIDYFNDLLEVLREMLACGVLPLAERLRVLLTALDILQGQGEALNVDRRQLYLQLYQTLMLVPLAPLAEGPGVHHGQGSRSKAAGAANGNGGSAAEAAGAAGQQREQQEDEQEDERAVMALHASSSGSDSGSAESVAVLLVQCVERLLLGSKQTDVARLAAFTKRLAGLLLHAGPGECMGLAALLLRLIKRYPRLAAQLEWDGGAPVGGRAFNADCTDPTEAGALAAALWELPLAHHHYHPHVAAAAKSLLELSPAAGASAGTGGTTGPLATAAGPQELALVYDSASTGRFKPAPAAPPKRNHQARHSKAAAQRLAAVTARPLCAEFARVMGSEEAALAGAGPKSQAATANDVHSSAHSAGAANGGVGAHGDEVEASEALLRHYSTSRRWQQNQVLRRQVALEAARLRRFQEHLIQLRKREKLREQEQAAAAAAVAAKKQQAAAAAEPQHQQQQWQKHKDRVQQPSALRKQHAAESGVQHKRKNQRHQS